MKWDGRERGEERGSEESEFAQAPDSRGSQLLKRTKLVRLFFQQGANFAIQKLDAIVVFQSYLCNNLWPLRRMEDSILSATLLPSPSCLCLARLKVRICVPSTRLRAASVTNKTENCRPSKSSYITDSISVALT